ncbi:hypothetical protein ACHHYP_12711 [Achlya hypogyna]|uniref:Helicase-associated domain-containing protein n=1 Tax=Achlya hypogyna TaxID=1202772 RepID=A0A1V9ZGE3_ACHHY|nr:hypothetical protein ACHHYP_12711 [Achlya hypogyna]
MLRRSPSLLLRTFAAKAAAAPGELPPKMLKKIDSFVQTAKIMRSLQAATSDYTIIHNPTRIPDEAPWPEDFRGKFLATTDIRKLQREGKLPPAAATELEKLNMVWDVNAYKWQMKIEALTAYKAVYGHTDVPYSFVVPDQDTRWPRDTWGQALGKQVSNILKEFHTSKRVKNQVYNNPTPRQLQLIALDFNWDRSGFS